MILEKAFKKHKDWIRIVVSFGCNETTAEDIVQEAYIKIDDMVKKGRDLSYKNDINYWYVYKILRHLYLHLRMKEKRAGMLPMPDIMRNDYNKWADTEDVLEAPTYIEYDRFEQGFEDVLSELTWYDRSIFEMVSSGKKISVLSRETNINYVSLWNTYKKVKEHIKIKIENYDWYRGFGKKGN